MGFKRAFILIFCLSGLPEKSLAQFYYGMQMDFGKNRIQYQNFEWTYYDFDRFKIYQYQGGGEIAKYTAVALSKQLPEMERRLNYQLDDKIQVLVYNNQNDFKQTNLGLANEDNSNIGGMTRIVGDKISLYFNGSHADYDRQIRAALAELMVDQYMYGGRTRDVLRNSTLLNLPDWYKQGLIAYLSEGWTSYYDNQLMDAIKNDLFLKFNHLTGKQATLAGHALWYYVADIQGEAVIEQILYMTKLSRNPDNAFAQITGNNLNNLMLELIDVFNKRYSIYSDSARSLPQGTIVLPKPKKTRHYYNLKLSPDGQKAVYASYEMSQVKVWLNTVGEDKQKRLLRMGPKVERIDDYNYPLLGWHPNNTTVAMIYERKNQMTLHTIDVSSGEKNKRNITGFEKINSFSFSADGKKMVISGVKKGKGQADIFVYTLSSGGLEQLTNDIWDDNNPVFIQNNTGVVFESNRRSDTVRSTDDAKINYKFTRNNDMFYAAYPFKNQILIRMTNTEDVNETQAQEYSKNQVSFLSEKNGIYNRYIAQFDSSISFVDTVEHFRYFFNSKPVTNYSRNIVEQNISTRHNKVAEIFYNEGQYKLMVSDLPVNPPVKTIKNTWFKTEARQNISNPERIQFRMSSKPAPEKTSQAERDTSHKQEGIDFNNYTLSGEKPKSKEKSNSQAVSFNQPVNKDTNNVKKANTTDELKFPIQQNYYTAFYTDYVMTQLDNSYLSTTYQKYTGGSNPIYLNPGLNALFKIGLSDLFEDRRIVAGFRIAGSLDNEYLLSYENRRRLVDQQVVLHRQSFLKVTDYYGDVAKIQTHDGRYSVKLPFNEVCATRLSLLYRNDRTVYASVGDLSLPKQNAYDNYAGGRLEFIFDNTRKRGLNLYNGIRFKVWGEYWRLIKNTRHDMINLGFDFRGYKKIHRDLIWCNRLAGGSSWGTDRLIYYLGGVDNWFNASFDQSINVVHPETYQFQTLATNMRGFKQNIRNGNNFVVFNSELRWPIFRYLLNRPIRSDFINNFQVIGFGDLGMAWYGTNPLSEDNVLNKNTYYNNPITYTIYNQKNPLVGGYGFGLRSRILGYFVRIDFSRGVDDMKVQKEITYVSFTTDF
jgi:Tol biopolymer transport system component